MSEHNKSPKTILIVEDDPFLANAYEVLLTHHGYTVLQAETGNKALELIKTPPDVIILDILLPDINGLTILEVVKKDPKTASIPVIISTNLDAESETHKKAIQMGADYFLLKVNTRITEVLSIIQSL